MVVVDDADVAVLSLVGTIDVEEIIGPEENRVIFIGILWYDGDFETLIHPDFLEGIMSMC